MASTEGHAGERAATISSTPFRFMIASEHDRMISDIKFDENGVPLETWGEAYDEKAPTGEPENNNNNNNSNNKNNNSNNNNNNNNSNNKNKNNNNSSSNNNNKSPPLASSAAEQSIVEAEENALASAVSEGERHERAEQGEEQGQGQSHGQESVSQPDALPPFESPPHADVPASVKKHEHRHHLPHAASLEHEPGRTPHLESVADVPGASQDVKAPAAISGGRHGEC